ncbi:Hypothetical protein KVN_LOCUS417 [uncultured virus]|nr:Hypothetical protein KVN_LOCUS417 [uncultured virus]
MTEEYSDNIINKFVEVSQNIIKRKRGRPRKNQGGVINEKKIIKNKVKTESYNQNETNYNNMSDEEEIILHLPINMNDINSMKKQLETKFQDKNINNNENIFEKKNSSSPFHETNIFTITDMSCESSPEHKLNENNSELINKIKILEEKIKNLQIENDEYRSIINDSINSGILNNKVTRMDLNFVNIINGQQILKEKTDIACWWCTYNFETIPCFIPERYTNEKYYVFGCFCCYNCAAAYNINMNDYKIWERYSLIKKIFNMNRDSIEEISIAPPRETLKKFGGPLSIEEFRKNCRKCEKEFRFIMPPMISIIPLIEENYKDASKFSNMRIKTNNDNLVLKRTKPLPNSKNTLIETFGIVKKK